MSKAFLIVAVVLFTLCSLGIDHASRLAFLPLGLAFVAASLLV